MTNGETSATAAAGWYDDGSGRQRYWDGTAWTDNFAAPAAPAASAPSAPGPRRLWPWFLGGGLVLLGLLIAAVVVIVVVVVLPATAGPDSTIKKYNEAWWTADCDGLIATTTDAYREGFVSADGEPFSCESFVSQSRDYYEGSEDFDIDITGVDVSGSTAIVEATETGEGPDGDYSDDWTYTLIRVGGHWLVDVEEVGGGED